MSSTAARLLVRALEAEGVKYVFGIPGEENIHFVDALNDSSIRYVLVRHEQGAAFMAEMYGRLTGKAGVASATLGPGAINLQLGVADATTNSTPVVAISAQVGLDRIYKESHQIVDLVSLFRPITKWAELVPTAAAVPEMLRKAFKIAQTERPGAVYLAIPEDVEKAPVSDDARPLPVNVVRPVDPSAAQIARAADLLATARRPIVLAGHGAARAGGPRRAGALLRAPGHPRGHHLQRQGRLPRRPQARARRLRLHAARPRELRLRRGRRADQRGLRAAGVRPRQDQP
ncbi:hypothetical protein GCM10020219_033860 [Nonomuraea dietziae]